MENTVIKGLLRNIAFSLATGGMLVACGGSDSGPVSNDAKLLADGEACAAAWVSTTAYTGGLKASYSGRNYTAAYWTQGNNPSTSSGPSGSGQPWIPGFLCGGTTTTAATTTTTKATTTTTKAGTTTTTKAGTTTTAATTTTTKATTTTTKAGGTCPAYVAGTSYAAGQTVTNAGGYYTCTVAGWCSSGASAYEPGVGWAWTNAWSTASASVCGGTTTTTKATSTTTNTGSTTTTGATTTTTVIQSGLPKHTLTGYWHNFTNPAGATYPIAQVSDNFDIIVLAFADNAGSGNVTFTPDPASGGQAQIIADIKAKQAKGKKVIISVGGETGNVDLSSAANTTNFINSMKGIINTYSLNGIDIDLENGMNAANVVTALRSLKTTFGANFIITMAPQTIDVQPNSNSAYMQVIRSAKDIITTVHTQHYNSGTMLGRNGAVYAQGNVDFLTALADTLMIELRPDQVAIGVPAAPGAAGSGYVAPSIVNNAMDCMSLGTNCGSYIPVAKYPTFRGVMTWSVNWDRSSGLAFSNAVKPKLNSMP